MADYQKSQQSSSSAGRPFYNKIEMIISSSNSIVFNPLSMADVDIERVDVFKLLGVYVNRSLKWDDHVRTICNKADSRIYFLKQLKRSSVEPEDIFMLLWSDQSSNMHVQFGIAI